MSKYAYFCLSTKDQSINQLLQIIEPYDIPKQNIYCDHWLREDSNRPDYHAMLTNLHKGDLVILKGIDSLGRKYDDILTEWQHLTQEIQADVLVLDLPIIDTRSTQEGLTGKTISEMVIQILAYVKKTERDYYKQRQAEGIAAAKAKGIRLGAEQKKMPNGFNAMCDACIKGETSIRKAAVQLGVNYATFYRHYKSYQEQLNLKEKAL